MKIEQSAGIEGQKYFSLGNQGGPLRGGDIQTEAEWCEGQRKSVPARGNSRCEGLEDGPACISESTATASVAVAQ